MLDFDGLAPVKPGERLDRPEDFGDAVLAEIRQRLPPAFKSVDCLLVATSSTGLPVNAKGEPANGCARFRAIFLLSRPLFFAEQKQIVIALKELPGLDCLDLAIYSVPQFSFIARPIFPPGMDDPIAKPVIPCKGGQSQIDVDLLYGDRRRAGVADGAQDGRNAREGGRSTARCRARAASSRS